MDYVISKLEKFEEIQKKKKSNILDDLMKRFFFQINNLSKNREKIFISRFYR